MRNHPNKRKVLFEEIGETESDDAALFVALLLFLLGTFLSTVMLLISGIMVGARTDKRSIHDLIAGTYVTHDLPGEPAQSTDTPPPSDNQ